MKTKRVTVLLASAVIGGSLFAAAPAEAQTLRDLPCEVFARPYDYPCWVANGAVNFVEQTVAGLGPFVEVVGDEVDEAADNAYRTVSCTVNPDDPEC